MAQPPNPPQFVFVRPPPQAPGAVAALVCGIIGVVTGCWGVGLVLGVVALYQARKARAAIAACPGMYSGEGMVTAGKILGIIATVMGALGVVYLIFRAAFMSWFFTSGVHQLPHRMTSPCPVATAAPRPTFMSAPRLPSPRATRLPTPLPGPEAP